MLLCRSLEECPDRRTSKSIFEAFGQQWSVLLNLPYWNPIQYTAIDSMHTLDLGLFQNHCRILFKIDTKQKSRDGSTQPTAPKDKRVTSKTDIASLHQCLQLIHSNPPRLLYELLNFHHKVLYTVCIDNSIRAPGFQRVVGTRWVLASNIHNWVCRFILSSAEISVFILLLQWQNRDPVAIQALLEPPAIISA